MNKKIRKRKIKILNKIAGFPSPKKILEMQKTIFEEADLVNRLLLDELEPGTSEFEKASGIERNFDMQDQKALERFRKVMEDDPKNKLENVKKQLKELQEKEDRKRQQEEKRQQEQDHIDNLELDCEEGDQEACAELDELFSYLPEETSEQKSAREKEYDKVLVQKAISKKLEELKARGITFSNYNCKDFDFISSSSDSNAVYREDRNSRYEIGTFTISYDYGYCYDTEEYIYTNLEKNIKVYE